MNRTACSLYELAGLIKTAVSDSFPESLWVIAEIAELKCNPKGHCYLELVEKNKDQTVAQIKATCWSYEYRRISRTFEKATGESLNPGMKIMLLASVAFHEVYGLSLNIRDIDPTYTMGEMARRKKEVIERLHKEGVIGLNRELPLPLVPQKIAVISSKTAAGYGDFFHQLDTNPYGYRFVHILFPALMQGREAEASIISSLLQISKKRRLFDIAVIIRGGGSVTDLSCFDSYELACHIARSPLPVITGIGHEKDDTVADIVAHTRMKTPTAVAEFLISGMREFEEGILEIQQRIHSCTGRILRDEGYRLDRVSQRLSFIPSQLALSAGNRLEMLSKDLESRIRDCFRNERNRQGGMEQAIRLLDPAQVLRRGYSITRHKGKILRDASLIRKGDTLRTTLSNGAITSIAKITEEDKGHEQTETAYLLPGF
ncbi:MAG: exodeoxyribonuclease VII large subunit [Nitrospirae bacterium]|nr:exodeoxyribonuclease VII large subunit [Nitrospirota bacterium]